MCQQFDVSKATIQRALSDLIRVGLIYRDLGKGAFVTGGAGLMNPALNGSIQDLIKAEKGIRLKVLSYREILVKVESELWEASKR